MSTVASPYMTTREVASYLRKSESAIRDYTRARRIPFRQAPGTRGCLYRQSEIDRWTEGDFDNLVVKELTDGGVVVRLVGGEGAQAS